jgi:glycosyltransferase involved in cell wall biosynthesis
MRIWLAPSAFAPHRGGVEELTLQLATTLRAAGHEVLVVTNRHPLSLAARETVEGVPVARIAFAAPAARPRAATRFLLGEPARQLALRALRPRPELIHIQCASVQTLPLLVHAKLRRVPLVLTTQGETAMDAAQIYRHSAYARASLRAAARGAAALSACSAWTAASAAEIAPRFADAQVIPNGVDPEQWQVGAPPADPVLCAWGRHVPQKGFDLALRAFARLRERHPQARLLLGGEGEETARLTALAGEGVELVGALDRAGVRRLLERSRVALVPSRVEPFGIVALEALAAGRGLVYAAGTGIVEAAGRCGRAVDVFDEQAFADAMAAELERPTTAEAGAARARELTWERIARDYEAVYATVLARG